MWQFLAMAGGMGLNILGSKATGEAQLAGMEAGVEIEKLQRDYMTQLFQKDIERQQPFVQIGEEATERLTGKTIDQLRIEDEEPLRPRPLLGGSAARDRRGIRPLLTRDPESGLGRMKRELLESGTEGMSDYVRDISSKRRLAEEELLQEARLQDLQKIGLGAAATAGQGVQRLGQSLAQSAMNIGGLQSAGMVERAGQRQDIWLQAGQALSGLPAYFAASRGPQWQTDYSIPMNVREY